MSSSTQIFPVTSRPATKPVIVWAVIGIAFLALTIYVFAAWMLSSDFKRVYPAVPLDDLTQSLVFWNQVVFSLITVICLGYWVVLPKTRTGRFSFMGLLVLASATTYWTDPLANYYSFGFAYNAGFWNRGSWANFIPGFSYPGMEKFPEAPFWVGTTYVWFNVGFPAMFAWIWRQIDQRYPNMGFGKVFVALLLTMGIWDVFNEVLYLRLNLYSYVGAPHDWSVFGGHYYQFPIFIGVVTAFFFMGITWVIHFRDDKGLCFVERGIDKVNVSSRISTFLRFLALTGYMNILTVGYWIPVQWLYTHGDSIPSDTPGYLINNLCGEKAGFPCPGKGVPNPRRDGNTTWVNMPQVKP